MAAKRPKPAKKVRFARPGESTDTLTSISLTPDTLAVLERLQNELGDSLGRSVSTSAILRALLRHAEQQKNIAGVLDSLISAELAAGVRWGKASKKRRA